MPDTAKLIHGLECCRDSMTDNPYGRCGDCPYNEVSLSVQECRSVLCKDALEVLKKLKKTKVVFRQYDGSVETECGNCGLYLGKTYSVCPKCGEELDWNA